jgi:ParB-like chromosome segregation protein Spo0J
MEYVKTFEGYNNYKETSWSAKIDGKDVTITIKDVEDLLKDKKPTKIPVSEIQDLSIHKDKKDKKTLKRISDSNLKFPIIISKLDGKYNRILDGHHRLQKAINTEAKFIKAKILDLDDAPSKYMKMFM